MTDKLQQYREQIDALDEQLIALLRERFAVTEHVGQYKKEHNIDGYDPSREAEMHTRYAQRANEYDLSPDMVDTIFTIIKGQVKHRHEEIRNTK